MSASLNIRSIQDEMATLIDKAEQAHTERDNPFPYEVFPLPIQQIVTRTNQTLKFPIDFIGSSLLYAAAVAIGNSVRVKVMPEWEEGCMLYIAIVGRAGTNKSHPLTFALRPIQDRDKQTYRQYEQERQEYEKAIGLNKKEREQQATDEPKKPIWRKSLLSDFTPEALAEVHKYNKRGVNAYIDELAGWIKNFNRYNKGSEQEFWLSAWSGKPISIDRKTAEPVSIPMPFISVVGTIQNSVLKELAKDNRDQNGFIDRFLFAAPDNLRKEYWSAEQLEPEVAESWRNIISNLFAIEVPLDDTMNPSPIILGYEPEAWAILHEWQKASTDTVNDSDDDTARNIGSKIEVYCIRFSLILEMLRYACRQGDGAAIGVDSVRGAIQLAEYFRKTAQKARSIISDASPLGVLPDDKHKLYQALPAKFTTGEGVRIAEQFGVKERAFKRFIDDKVLFKQPSWGEYEKLL